ncbi:hypothetical protein ABFS83_13G103400 [Erythranthe nasuta]
MATSAKQNSFFLLLTLFAFGSLHHTHARDSQFFNKIPSTTSKNIVVSNNKESPATQQPADQDPNFLPENENGYGLYGHESGQLPPSATTTGEPSTTTPAATTESKQPLHKYLPKNYNPVAYVTQPELDVTDNSPTLAEENSYTTDPDTINSNNNYYNGEQKYYNGQQETEETEYYRSYPTATTTTTAATNNNNNKYYYNNNNNAGGGSSFNSQPQEYYRGGSSATTFNSRERRSNNGGGFQPQGLSDTRSLENGKYYYDVSTEKYSTNHPYQNLRGSVRPRNNDQLYGNRNYYENSENNVGEFNRENTMGGYQNQENQYQYEEDNNMP